MLAPPLGKEWHVSVQLEACEQIYQPAGACGISPLDHELLYHTVELCTVVVTPSGKLRKISVKTKVKDQDESEDLFNLRVTGACCQ